MKNKFLVLAMVTAILATFALPGIGFAATTGDSSAEIGVTADTTLTLVLNGQSASAAFALEPFIANDSDMLDVSIPTDAIVVTDYTGDASDKNGHIVSVQLNSGTWWYSGVAAGGVDAAMSTSGTPGADEVVLALDADATTFTDALTFADVTEDACTPSGVASSTMDGQAGPYTNTEAKVLWNSGTCPGASSYPPRLAVIGPSNGLFEGTYTISGTYVLYDDVDTTL